MLDAVGFIQWTLSTDGAWFWVACILLVICAAYFKRKARPVTTTVKSPIDNVVTARRFLETGDDAPAPSGVMSEPEPTPPEEPFDYHGNFPVVQKVQTVPRPDGQAFKQDERLLRIKAALDEAEDNLLRSVVDAIKNQKFEVNLKQITVEPPPAVAVAQEPEQEAPAPEQ